MTTTFTYNGDGHRLAKSENGETTIYAVAVLGLSQVLMETTAGESVLYLYGHDLLAEEGSSGWAYHLGDGLGSVRQLADGGGDVSLAQGYTPFGVPMWSEGSGATGYGFTGERWEAYNELLFLRARYYEPGTGRFLSKDSWAGDSYQPLTMNLYLYVLANPTRWVDPTGLFLTEGGSTSGCQESCEIHGVVKFIVRRIREDAASQDIEEIYELNTTHFYEDAWVECQRMPWWQRFILCPDYQEGARSADRAARVEALAQFGCLVADGVMRPVCGQWDYKVDISDSWGEAQKIDFCSIGCDEKVDFYYDIWANVHFMYVGLAGGFSEEDLLNGAALEHFGSTIWKQKKIQLPIRDDPSDEVMQKIGASIFYGNTLTEEALLRQLYQHRHEVNKAEMDGNRIIRIYR